MIYFQIIFFIKLFILIITESDVSFLYKTNHNLKTNFDCFYAHIIDDLDEINKTSGIFLRTNYLTPFCLRPLLNDSIDDNLILIEGYVDDKISFKTLRSRGIKSEQLFEWSISIDINEQYAIYLIENDTKFDDYIFYNCSSLWFGSHCQYTFGLDIPIKSFGDFIVSSFNNREQFSYKLRINTCYSYLNGCYRGPKPMCLDWREICNGIIDCIGDNYGIDEKYCEELEMNECAEDEYRCHNGAQCIPLEFFQDGWISKDCLDGTDEVDVIPNIPWTNDFIRLYCIKLLTFTCEERSCRDIRSFPCGDGECRKFGLINNYINPYGLLCPGTSRDTSYLQAIYTSNKHLSSDCEKLLLMKLKISLPSIIGKYDYEDKSFKDWLSTNNCSMNYIPFPADPIFNDHFQIIYSSEDLINSLLNDKPPTYVCNDPRQCLHLPKTILQIGGLDCRPFEEVVNVSHIGNLYYLHSALTSLALSCSTMGNRNEYRSNSSLFYCKRSHRYISKHRLIDGIADCYENEDEDYSNSCLLNNSLRFKCTSEDKCLSPVGLGIALPDCKGDEDKIFNYFKTFVFGFLCDRILDYTGVTDEDDESNCQQWPCFNPYTRCDHNFQCMNGIDELDCPNSGCAKNEFKCYEEHNNYPCISQDYIYEKIINCSKYNGEKMICAHLFYSSNLTNNKNKYLSWKENSYLIDYDICSHQSINNQHLVCNLVVEVEDVYKGRFILNIDDNDFLCSLQNFSILPRLPNYFSAFNLGYLPSTINITSIPFQKHINIKTTKTLPMNTNITLIEYCNRGIIIYEGKSYKKKCLCPPNYFGDQCQWQNQRVSLTLRIRKLSSAEKNTSIYDIFIYLIDDEYGTIHYYEEINYIPSRDCETKYNRYLLYPTRPKNSSRTYSIHIDMYDKLTLNYYASWYLFIPFPFLPVNRLATQIIIPFEKSQSLKKCSLKCGIHGKCFNYVNSTKSFCKCNQEYSGHFCNIKHECSCSSDSICLNSSICLCLPNKYGSKCYLEHTSCPHHNNPCKNNGQCIPTNHRNNNKDFICLCPEDYMGSNCEYKTNTIDIIFKTNIIPSIIFAHFINALDNKPPGRITTFKKLPFDQNSVTLSIKESFNILFIEFLNDSYLAVLREKYFPSEHISIDITINNMCLNVTKLLNSTIFMYSYLRRLKHYQLPCLKNSQLTCFYDEKHICICDKNRYSNCLEFNHNMSYDCRGYNPCQNNGKCFQDNVTCPTTSMCMCEKCYYGTKCQFNTKGFSLSLDAIFGYHIKPFVSFSDQSKAVKIVASLTIVMFVLGAISGSLSIFTFQRETSIEVGCGIYLLSTSITSLLTIIFFTIKYWQLVLFQMRVITNGSFLYFNCLLTDVLLKVFLNSGDWLNACVGIERAYTAIRGVRFNKLKSKYTAKRVIPIIFLLTIASYIHDPISRELFDDKDEARTWCIVNYSSQLKIFDTFINLFHFVTPFIINFLSALIIIIRVFKMRTKTQTKALRRIILYTEIRRHKHLLIAPCILITLACPRLLISLISQCMESPRDPWLFLTGYYISFVPSLLLFVIFVLPSERYKNEFSNAIRKACCVSQ